MTSRFQRMRPVRLLPVLAVLLSLLLPSTSSAFVRRDLSPDASFLAAETCRNVPVAYKDPDGREFILIPHTWGVRSAGESWYDSLYPGRADIAGWWAGNREAGRVAVSGTKKAAVGLYDVGRVGVDVTRMAGWSIGGGDAAQFEFYSDILQTAATQDPDQLFKNIAVGTLKAAPTLGIWNLAEAEAGTFGAASVSGNYDEAAALNIQLLALASAPKVGNAIRRNVAGATRALADRMILRTTLADCRVPRVGPTIQAAASKSTTALVKYDPIFAVQQGSPVYRLWGEGTVEGGRSWTTVNPRSFATVEEFKQAAGIGDWVRPPYRTATGQFSMQEGVTVRTALKIENSLNPWLPELRIEPPLSVEDVVTRIKSTSW